MKQEKSCGAVVFTQSKEDLEFLLIQHSKGRHWGFPKGHVDEGETEHQTALREIYEEIGLNVELLEGFREEEQYSSKPGVSKTVVYFLAKASTQEVTCMPGEIDAHVWLNFCEALEQLTFESSQHVLRQAYEYVVHLS